MSITRSLHGPIGSQPIETVRRCYSVDAGFQCEAQTVLTVLHRMFYEDIQQASRVQGLFLARASWADRHAGSTVDLISADVLAYIIR